MILIGKTYGKKQQSWPADQVERRAVADLVPYARNSRTHTEAQIAAVAASIREWGWTTPVLVAEDNTIIAGHARVMAAQRLGLADVPVMVAAGWTEAQRRAYVIADNQLALQAGWDAEMLRVELGDIDASGFDLDLLGFDADELAGLMDGGDAEGDDAEGEDTEPETDRAEELREKWGVETGQLWQLGEHRLLCGDSTKAEDVARVMGGERADAVLTDPPYGQNQKGVPNDEPGKHSQLMADVIKQLPITDGVVVAFQSPRTFHAWTDAARKAGLTFERMLWMYKAAQCTFPWRGWILKSESIPVCSIGNPQWQEVHPFAHDCYYLSEVSGELDSNSGWHGSVKPMTVVSDLLSRISSAGQIIYKPFSGSGTTIIACENLKQKCRAIEISPAYVAVAIERWHQHTGQVPTLLAKADAAAA